MADETRPLDAAHVLCGRLLKYYCPDELAIADKALTQKFNEGYDVGFNQAREDSRSIRDAAMAEARIQLLEDMARGLESSRVGLIGPAEIRAYALTLRAKEDRVP